MPSIKNIRGHAGAPRELSWSAEERLRFIEAAAFWDGRVNRADLIRAFGISVPQASIDLKRYQELAPENLRYSPAEKSYLAAARLKLVFDRPDAEAWLAGRAADGAGPAGRLVVEQVPQPARTLDPWLLRRVVSAAREGLSLHIRYQSMDKAGPAWMWIVPRAIVTNGQRWHLRAYNVDRNRYEDLLFPRITDIDLDAPAPSLLPEDVFWERVVTVVLRPAARLSPTQQAVVARDYGMTENSVGVPVRSALLFLFLRRIGADRDQAVIEVVNRDDVDAELARARQPFATDAGET